MKDSFANIIWNKIKDEMEISYKSLIYLLFGLYIISLSLFLYFNGTGSKHDLTSVYGLFLFLFAIPLLVLNEPHIFQIKRNLLTFIIGILIEILAIILCLIPNLITETPPVLLGVLLFFGGITLLSKIFLEESKNDPKTIEIKLVCSIIYFIAIVIGANNMFKAGLDLNIIIPLYSIPFFYLTYRCIDDIELRRKPEKDEKIVLLRNIYLESDSVLALILGVFIITLGILMLSSNVISINGIASLMLLILSIQVTFNGISPAGVLDRNIWLYSLGFIGLILAMISCLLPNIFTTGIIYLVAFLNISCIVQIVDLTRILINHYHKMHKFKFTIPIIGMICSIFQYIITIIFGIFFINQNLIPKNIMSILLIIMGLDIGFMIFLNEKNKPSKEDDVKYF